MHKRIGIAGTAFAAGALLGGAALLALPGHADTAAPAPTFYGNSAAEIAATIGCRNFVHLGHDAYDIDSGRCGLGGHRVKVRTYSNPDGQAAQSQVQAGNGASYFWATAPGVLVTAYDGDEAAAQLAASRLPGTVEHG